MIKIIKTRSFNLAVYVKGDVNAKKVALVLPGKLDTKDYAHMRSHVDFLARRGFLAVSFDPPGTWESPGDITIYTMTNYLKATNELIDYFNSRPTLVVGHSRGSSIGLFAAMGNQHVIACVAIMCSLSPGKFTNQRDDEWKIKGYTTEMRDLPPGGGAKTKRFDLPYSFFEDQRQYDLADGLKKLIKPKLFVLGTQDDMAPPRAVRGLFELSAEPKWLYELESDHDYRRKPELIRELNDVIGDFLDRNSI